MDIDIKQIDTLWIDRKNSRNELIRRRKYFDGKHKITERGKETFANGREKTSVVTNFAEYVVDMYTGALTTTDYQITKMVDDGDKTNYAAMADELGLNATDVENLQNTLVYGYALELHEFVDGRHVITAQRPEKWALVRDEAGRIMIAINRILLPKHSIYNGVLLKSDSQLQYVYDEHRIKSYKRERAGSELWAAWELINDIPHFYGAVPLVEWKTDSARRALLTEALIHQIDEYNDIDSLSGDDIRDTSDALLKIKNIDANWAKDNQDIIRKQRVLNLPEDADAEYLIKVTDVARIESRLARCREAIHIMAGVPDIEQIVGVTGGTSGIALQLKFMPMRQRAGAMVKELAKGMRARIDMLNAITSKVKQNIIDNYTVTIQFSMPVNRIEEWQNIGALDGIVTHRTQLELLTDINDPDGELEELQKEDVIKAETMAVNENPDVVAAKQDLAVNQAAQIITPSIENAMNSLSDRLIAVVKSQAK